MSFVGHGDDVSNEWIERNKFVGIPKSENKKIQSRIQKLTPPGPRIPPFQSDKNVSAESTNPKERAMSPAPFSLFSSSSRSLKFLGTMTTSPAGVLCMVYQCLLLTKSDNDDDAYSRLFSLLSVVCTVCSKQFDRNPNDRMERRATVSRNRRLSEIGLTCSTQIA